MPSKFVTSLILLFALAVWSVVGFLIWLPILIRAVTVLSFMVIHGAVVRQSPDHLRGYLDAASGFYFNGFRLAYEAVFGSAASDEPREFRLGRFIGECAYTLLFWFITLLTLRPAQGGSILATLDTTFTLFGKLPATGQLFVLGVISFVVYQCFKSQRNETSNVA